MSQNAQDNQTSTPGLPTSEPPAPRPARSKNGCNACRRRKVRCNERRPRCAHCERLNLDCTWNRVPTSRGNTVSSQISASPHVPPTAGFNSNTPAFDGLGLNGNAFFDFSGPLGVGTWDEALLLSPNSWPSDAISAPAVPMDIVPAPIHQLPSGHQSAGPPFREASRSRHADSVSSIPERGLHHPDPASTSPFSSEGGPNLLSVDDDFLVNTFLQMLMPPILTPVEIGPKWASTRAFFGTMAAESVIVRSAIMAFAAMQMSRSGLTDPNMRTDWRPLYDNASRQLSAALAQRKESDGKGKEGLKFILAAFFLLTYTDVSCSLYIKFVSVSLEGYLEYSGRWIKMLIHLLDIDVQKR